jgi:hypothetical protein
MKNDRLEKTYRSLEYATGIDDYLIRQLAEGNAQLKNMITDLAKKRNQTSDFNRMFMWVSVGTTVLFIVSILLKNQPRLAGDILTVALTPAAVLGALFFMMNLDAKLIKQTILVDQKIVELIKELAAKEIPKGLEAIDINTPAP